MTECFALIFDLLSQLVSVQMPWGLSFGVTVAGAVSIPLAYCFFRRFFS